MPKTITVTIKPDGKKIVDLDGFNGIGCAAVLAAFTKGEKITKEIHKPEYNVKQAKQVCQ